MQNKVFKRYMVFEYGEHFPKGGVGDCTIDSDNLNQLLHIICIKHEKPFNIEIYDNDLRTLIVSGRYTDVVRWAKDQLDNKRKE